MQVEQEAIGVDSGFPFWLTYRMRGRSEFDTPIFHFHDMHEIVIVHEGEGDFFIENQRYAMKKGSVFAIAGDAHHRSIPDKRRPFLCSVVLFRPSIVRMLAADGDYDPLQPFYWNEGHRQWLTGDELSLCELMLGEMNGEWSGARIGCRHALVVLLHRLLLAINRRQTRQDEAAAPALSRSAAWMNGILRYIDDHLLDERMTLDWLARQALVGPEHFSRTFRRATGCTLPAYLSAKRMIRAKELLLHSDHSISYIADSCGFGSVSYFHHTFKKQAGMTPALFRRISRMGES